MNERQAEQDAKEYFLFMLAITLAALVLIVSVARVSAHDIYSGVTGKGAAGQQQLCCGGNDCAVTKFRENGDRYEFLTREGEWVAIPQDRITFLPIPGDDKPAIDGDEHHKAHLCYRRANDYDFEHNPTLVFGPIVLFCAFTPPGAI